VVRGRFSEVRLGEQWIRWKGPTCAANNVLVPGKMWLDYYGPSVVEVHAQTHAHTRSTRTHAHAPQDVANGLTCELHFEAATWKNAYAGQHKFAGTVRDAEGSEVPHTPALAHAPHTRARTRTGVRGRRRLVAAHRRGSAGLA
jgi:hypothetical protein